MSTAPTERIVMGPNRREVELASGLDQDGDEAVRHAAYLLAVYRAELQREHDNDVSDHVLHVLDDIENMYRKSGDVLGLIALFRRDYARKDTP